MQPSCIRVASHSRHHKHIYLAITLGRLDDFENACSAFDKVIEMERDILFHLNCAITLYNNDEMERAKVQFDRFEEIFETLDDEAKNADQEVLNVLID